MFTKFYLIRHGDAYPDTLDNIQLPNTPLNERGKVEAEKLRSRVNKIQSESLIVLCSTHQRAKETMEISTKNLDVKPIFMKELVEIGADFWPNPEKLHTRTTLEPPSYKEEERKVRIIFEDLWKKYNGKTVLIFTHGNWIRALISNLMGAGWAGFNKLVINLTSLTILDESEDGIPLISSVSETAHLI